MLFANLCHEDTLHFPPKAFISRLMFRSVSDQNLCLVKDGEN